MSVGDLSWACRAAIKNNSRSDASAPPIFLPTDSPRGIFLILSVCTVPSIPSLATTTATVSSALDREEKEEG